ncbi:4-hydroxybenzoate octaprenyltransferase [Pseudidiomarina insulisalsae]|uniref:4-hydroxybenzoate octaprenyltransferase n=1 Tax=Pseudidiomarina insulisalsae TaxID=575789 RepID=A0A432YPG3_9GAMM|nr:4-hydroxybenzoate octaprenyltransferase [Pseudidiomarina insulisalsae]RUO63006.1 4-hydroxybenzoate octaprenyltransferase [Pseudidiomarina insulisalsae]
MANPYWRLMRADRPIGTLLLAWPMLAALIIAGAGDPPLKVVVLFLLGAFVMRSAGCVINDFADRNIDGHVSRTRQRPLAAGELKSWQALALFAGLLLIAFLIVLQFNKATILLSIAAAGVAILYPFCKRFTQLPQVVLGVAFSFGILMPFTALDQGLPLVAWVLFAANICWTVAYDTEYAMADRADDLKIGVKSTAILFGGFDRLAIAVLQLATLALLVVLGHLLSFGLIYWLGLIVIAGLFIWQHGLIWYREPQRCFRAFLHNNHVGWVLAAAVAASYWYR